MEWLVIPAIGLLIVGGIYFWWSRDLTFQPAKYSKTILDAGNQSGRPKGLRWVRCEPNGELIRDSNQIYSPYEIQFEVVSGSEMEDIEAATIPRPVVAIFRRTGRRWRLVRAPIFNLTLNQVKSQFQ